MPVLLPDATAFASIPLPWMLIGLFVLYRIGLSIYRLYFHPLAKFPGPKLYAVTGIPFYYNDKFKGTFFAEVKDLHEKYGPFVRVTPNRLIVDATISNPEILARAASRPEFGKTTAFYGVDKPIGIASAPREEHRRQRRLLAHAFSESALREQEDVIRAYVDLFIKRVQEHAVAGKPMNLEAWFNFLTFDIIGDMAFGEDFGSLESGVWHPWVDAIVHGIRFYGILQIMQAYPIMSYLIYAFSPGVRDLARKSQDNQKLARQQTEKRIALGADARLDFMTYILRSDKDGQGMPIEDLHQNTKLLLIGGSETTATALVGLFFFLTRAENRHTRDSLIEEIRSAGFATPADITMVSTSPLRYLYACLEETIRLYPPAVFTPPRISPGDVVAGQFIPKGVECDTHTYAAGRSPKNFRDPDRFCPERWLPPTHPLYVPGKFDHDNKAALKAFSVGPRDCIGKNLAYAEMRIVVSLLLWHFDFEALPGQDDWISKQKSFNAAWWKGPLNIQFTPRVFEGKV